MGHGLGRDWLQEVARVDLTSVKPRIVVPGYKYDGRGIPEALWDPRESDAINISHADIQKSCVDRERVYSPSATLRHQKRQ
jgi:hypothetical protein